MQVGQKNAPQLRHGDPSCARLLRRGGAAHHSRAAIDDVWRVIHDDGY
jgi:hypothetical protein